MPKRILIVDDAPVTVTQVRHQLEQTGYHVEIATNGMEGLAVINTRPVDLIITDIVMPVMDGIDFYKELQKSDLTKHVPVIVITDSVMIQESFRTLGVNDFIAKPIDGRDLLQRIDNLFKLAFGRSKYGKILVVGNNIVTLKEMRQILENASGFTVQVAEGGMDAMTLALKMVPDILLLDVLLQDISSKEVIRAMKCFSKLNAVKIFLYTEFNPEDMSDIYLIEQLKESKNACLDAGALKYIGRFSRTTFIEALKEIL